MAELEDRPCQTIPENNSSEFLAQAVKRRACARNGGCEMSEKKAVRNGDGNKQTISHSTTFNGKNQDVFAEARSRINRNFIEENFSSPGAHWKGDEFYTLNPTRPDKYISSFSINESGKCKDFADDSCPKDVIGLYAKKHGIADIEAARKIAGVNGNGSRKASKAKQHGKPDHTYPWHDENGRPLFKTYRIDAKNGNEKDCWIDTGVRNPKPPYDAHLLKLNPKKTVLISEGEPCAELAKKSFPEYNCTTWQGGSNNDHHTDFSILAGREVILWPDNDEPGRNAMNRIASRLVELGCNVRMVNYDINDHPKGWDIADCLAEYQDTQPARDLIEHAIPWEPALSFELNLISAREIQVKDFPARTWYGLGITRGLIFIVAKKGCNKTIFAVQQMNAIADGLDFLGQRTIKIRVLYVSNELDEQDFNERFTINGKMSDNLVFTFEWSRAEQAIADAETAIKKYGFGIIVFDSALPLIPELDFKVSEYGDSGYWLKWRQMAKRNNAAIVCHWHTGKAQYEDFMSNAIGSTGMIGQADSVIELSRKRHETELTMKVGGNHAAERIIKLVRNDDFTISLAEYSEEDGFRLTREEQKVLDAFSFYPEGATTDQIGVRVGKDANQVRKQLNTLKAKEFVFKPAGTRAFWKLVNKEEILFDSKT